MSPVVVLVMTGILADNLTVADSKALSIVGAAERRHSVGVRVIVTDGSKVLSVQVDVLCLQEINARKCLFIAAACGSRFIIHTVCAWDLFLDP